MALASGTRLGPYEIQSAIGAGGMGEVYRARDTRLERTVAIKILPEHLSSSGELRARFEREARAVSSLNHPLFGERKPYPIVQTAFNDMQPAVSSDGKWMAYSNNESGRYEIYVTGFPGGGAKWQASANGGAFPRWRRDGKELFFLDPADKVMAADVSPLGNTVRMGTPHALFHAGGIQTQQGPYAVTADGKKFLINSGDVKEESQPLTLVQNWPAELKK